MKNVRKLNVQNKTSEFFLQVMYFLFSYPLGTKDIRLYDNLLQSHKFER